MYNWFCFCITGKVLLELQAARWHLGAMFPIAFLGSVYVCMCLGWDLGEGKESENTEKQKQVPVPIKSNSTKLHNFEG